MRRHAKASSAASIRSSAERRSPSKALALASASFLLLVLVAALLAPGAGADVAQPPYLGSFGPDGTEATDFESLGPVGVDEETGVVYVGDRTQEALYRFDEEGHPLDWSGTSPYISGNEISGVAWPVGVTDGGSQIAVDPETHVIYLTTTTENGVRALEASGEPHEFSAGPGAGTSEIPRPGPRLNGVAVDGAGTIYASYYQYDPTIFSSTVGIYSRSGAPLTEFEPKAPTGIAAGPLTVAPDGSLYISAVNNPTYRFEPSHFPLDGSTTYSLGEELAKGTFYTTSSIALDPTTNHVYLGEQINGPTGAFFRVDVYDEDDNFVGSLGGPGQEGEIRRPVGLAVNGGAERVYVASRAEPAQPGQMQVKVFGTFVFAVEAPSITAPSVIDLNLYTATLRGQVNPNTLTTTYHFEYGPEDCAVSACASTPGGSIEPGHKPVGVSEEIAGLEPGTTYHYRVVAENAKGTTKGPDKTFTTPRSGLGFTLADNRAWEMVSPPNKFGGKILHFSQGVMQAAANGNGVAYQTVTSIEPNPDGNRATDTSTVLARRSGDRWSNKDITPAHTEVGQVRPGGDYKTFSTNLERALFEQQENTPLSIEASEEAPYLRENSEPPTYRPLVTGKEGYANVPEGTVFGGGAGSAESPVMIAAADSSLTHPVIRSRTPLIAGAAQGSLYSWADGELQPVSELPPGEGGGVIEAGAGTMWGSIRHAVSDGGSRVFWSPGEFGTNHSTTALYVRDTAEQTTGRLDLAQADASGEGKKEPSFLGASADGEVAFFTDSERLTANASPPDPFGRVTLDLYRCEVGPVEGGTLGCTALTDLSAPLEGSGERADVLGLPSGLSEDGTHAYFVARGVLDANQNEFGDSAIPGEPNLYLWQAGKGTRFIATLSARDEPDWGTKEGAVQSSNLSAAASPDGRYLAFMSERSLTGYDNRDAKSEEPVEEAFSYDAVEDRLVCASCNPSGASPEGIVSDPTGGDLPRADVHSNWSQRWVAAILPAPQESEPTNGLAFYHPRTVHNNGRVFFNATDPLVSADSNGEWDVYQWEPTGVGDCTESSSGAAIARSAGGCVSLLSSGTAEEEATFVDASESGDDVFFITPARLSVTDEDFELDVYDTRVDGVPATLPVINECLGEACQPAPNPPNDPTPASASFHGSGNVPSERCPASKRKVIRAGSPRCVSKKHKRKHSHKKAKRAANKRRAHR